MRIGKVIGRATMSQAHEALTGGRFLLVEIQDRFSLTGKPRKTSEVLVAYDNIGSSDGDLVALSESREAVMPFYPERRIPIDAYCAAILDRVVVSLEI